MCRARSTTIACLSAAGCTTDAISFEVRRDLATWLAKWSGKFPELIGWVEDNMQPGVSTQPMLPGIKQRAFG
jgi:hypothetical protein